jgi:hypothetical protein
MPGLVRPSTLVLLFGGDARLLALVGFLFGGRRVLFGKLRSHELAGLCTAGYNDFRAAHGNVLWVSTRLNVSGYLPDEAATSLGSMCFDNNRQAD